MKSRFISLVLVLVMCSCALFVISSDDSAADEGMKEIKIYSDNSGVSYTHVADPIYNESYYVLSKGLVDQ